MAELSEYERARLDRIAENQAKLAELGLSNDPAVLAAKHSAADKVAAGAERKRKARENRAKKKQEQKKRKAAVPLRRSSRACSSPDRGGAFMALSDADFRKLERGQALSAGAGGGGDADGLRPPAKPKPSNYGRCTAAQTAYLQSKCADGPELTPPELKAAQALYDIIDKGFEGTVLSGKKARDC
eukprot:g1287.t1